MANFKQHISGGVIAGAIATPVAMTLFPLTLPQGLLVLFLTSFGAMVPDVDSNTSKPLGLIFNYLGLLLPIILLNQFQPEATIETTLIVLVLGAVFIQKVIYYPFVKLTHHRGMIHSIPAIFIYGALIFHLFFDSEDSIRFIFAGASSLGFLVHLVMDEIWSIDVSNMRIKKSFGTALKLFNKKVGVTLLTYVILLALLYPIYTIFQEY